MKKRICDLQMFLTCSSVVFFKMLKNIYMKYVVTKIHIKSYKKTVTIN